MFHGGDDDDEEEEPHDKDDADEQHQVPEEESKVANQHRSSVDMTAHPQVIACHHNHSWHGDTHPGNVLSSS